MQSQGTLDLNAIQTHITLWSPVVLPFAVMKKLSFHASDNKSHCKTAN